MSGHNLKRPRPMPQLTSHNPHSASQGLGPTPPSTDTAQEKGTFGATPLPDNFWDLPWRERRYYEKMRAEQVRGMREWDKADRQRMIAEEMGAKMRMRAEEEERKWREKSEKRRWKEEIK
jgi:hypothetical protein